VLIFLTPAQYSGQVLKCFLPLWVCVLDGRSASGGLRPEGERASLGNFFAIFFFFLFYIFITACFAGKVPLKMVHSVLCCSLGHMLMFSKHRKLQKKKRADEKYPPFRLGERNVEAFGNNRLTTHKYTVLTFLPKNLFEQFRKGMFLPVAC
jgi:hypothetical protein